jgi:hypothetical protein
LRGSLWRLASRSRRRRRTTTLSQLVRAAAHDLEGQGVGLVYALLLDLLLIALADGLTLLDPGPDATRECAYVKTGHGLRPGQGGEGRATTTAEAEHTGDVAE